VRFRVSFFLVFSRVWFGLQQQDIIFKISDFNKESRSTSMLGRRSKVGIPNPYYMDLLCAKGR
jgi:hypothetical protein